MHALLFTLALALEPRELERMLDAAIPSKMAEKKIPGAVVMFVQRGRVVFAKGYGVADVTTKQPMTPDTIVPIASITKVVTAVGVAQLADRGHIDLHADVNRYLKSIKVPDGKPITAAHLLTHSAGFDELPGRMVREGPVQPLAKFLAKRLIRVHEPGELTSYSSYGGALMGVLIEDVSGLPYERYLVANVFAPLRMNRTQVTIPEELRGETATPYEEDEGKLVAIPFERYHTPPSSSLSSTANDMSRFMLAILGGGAPILSPKMNAEMMKQQATMHPLIPGFGYGWQMADTNGQRIVEHGGDIGGFASLLVLLPEHDAAFFIANHREGSELRYDLRTMILDRFFPGPPITPPKRVASTNLTRYAGTYRSSTHCHTCAPAERRAWDVEVKVNGDGTLSVYDERWVELAPGFFRSVDGRKRIGFHENARGEITALTSGSFRVMEKVPVK